MTVPLFQKNPPGSTNIAGSKIHHVKMYFLLEKVDFQPARLVYWRVQTVNINELSIILLQKASKNINC